MLQRWILFVALVTTTVSAQPKPEPAFRAVEGTFFALSVQDVEASVKWYSNAFGLTVASRPSAADPAVAILTGNGLEIELMAFKNSTAAADPFDAKGNHPRGIVKVGFVVADLDRTLAALRAKGVAVAMGPFPGRRDQRANVVIKDNSGNLIQILGAYAR